MSSTDARDATAAAFGPEEHVEERETGEGGDDIVELQVVSDLRRNIGSGPLALEGVKSLRESLLLSVPATVMEAQKLIEDAIRAFADHPKLEASVTTKGVALAAAQEKWDQKKTFMRNS